LLITGYLEKLKFVFKIKVSGKVEPQTEVSVQIGLEGQVDKK
jgi:hypothetical protein